MSTMNFQSIIALINEEFDDAIDKKQLIRAIKTKETELKRAAKEAKADKPPSVYNVYMWEKMKNLDLGDIAPKERMSYISKMWKEEADQYKADKKWYNATSEKMRQDKIIRQADKDAKKAEKDAEREAQKEAKKAQKEAEKDAKKADKKKEAAKEPAVDSEAEPEAEPVKKEVKKVANQAAKKTKK
ncbi:hypothetical protein GUITHDRAFT_101338 [Guillardia theta CCMP2712]|uniref:Uncharacterized protein n=1 Tax=Guillardia theta (strain CCMP2712) TaxID=905079 RepID=L1JWE2_GUITC|nr:hypothetical protein GUITHDRAFT_101338 [Guillardia theta CCMP2712]EKX52886.1 hypothetical protein GUITHDRAFT_101338 [Guillardia theta CCMP2712]|eukprot:XP_005839866.1 hypothetical protein GUITHDRAFT_101338 [Guillardia theta CCMP2712]